MARVIETKTITDDTKAPCKSAAEMTELCCQPTGALQCCEESDGEWHGYNDEEILDHLGIVIDAKGRDKQGRYVVIEKVPRQGPCGEKVIRYDLSQNNCCEDVEPLAWDMDVTPDVLPHGSSIIIAWEGSDGREVEVRTSSNGTYFAGGRKSVTGHGTSIELSADETFCGATRVTVRDGCSEASVLIRSDLGAWRYVGNVCVLPDVENQGVDFSGSWSAISGVYQQLESVNWHQTVFMATNQPNCEELPGLCGTPGSTCLRLSAVAEDVPCTGDGASLGTGSYRCGRSGLSQRRYDPYANHDYTRFWTTSLSALVWGC